MRIHFELQIHSGRFTSCLKSAVQGHHGLLTKDPCKSLWIVDLLQKNTALFVLFEGINIKPDRSTSKMQVFWNQEP